MATSVTTVKIFRSEQLKISAHYFLVKNILTAWLDAFFGGGILMNRPFKFHSACLYFQLLLFKRHFPLVFLKHTGLTHLRDAGHIRFILELGDIVIDVLHLDDEL